MVRFCILDTDRSASLSSASLIVSESRNCCLACEDLSLAAVRVEMVAEMLLTSRMRIPISANSFGVNSCVVEV